MKKTNNNNKLSHAWQGSSWKAQHSPLLALPGRPSPRPLPSFRSQSASHPQKAIADAPSNALLTLSPALLCHPFSPLCSPSAFPYQKSRSEDTGMLAKALPALSRRRRRLPAHTCVCEDTAAQEQPFPCSAPTRRPGQGLAPHQELLERQA